MTDFVQMAGIQSVLFVYMLAGYLCFRFGILDDHARRYLTDLAIYVTLPCMIFQSFDITLTPDKIRAGATALLIAAVMALVVLALNRLLFNWCPPNEKPVLQYGTLVSNAGFAGLPVVESAYGPEGLFLASLFIIPTRILMWSAGISLFTDAPRRQRIKNVLLNPGIIAVELGLVRMLLSLPVPAQLGRALSGLGGCTSPLAMMVIGLILAQVDLKTVVEPKAFLLVVLRQLVLPFGLLASLRLLGIDPLTIGVAVVLTGMPIGSTTAILAAKYGADAAFASKCVFISTLTSLVTVPILTLFL